MLRKKDNVYLPSDKGGEFCVIDLQTYNDLAVQHLNDTETFRKIICMSVEGKMNTVLHLLTPIYHAFTTLSKHTNWLKHSKSDP